MQLTEFKQLTELIEQPTAVDGILRGNDGIKRAVHGYYRAIEGIFRAFRLCLPPWQHIVQVRGRRCRCG